MNGWAPTITAETQRRNELNTCIVFLAQKPDNKYWQNRLACVRDAIDAEKLAELVDKCNTDPAHIARVSDDYTETLEHMTNAAYMDGTEPSPFIWGGEVYYPEAKGGDDDMPL